MTESVVYFAIERLGDLLIEECKFLSEVSDQVEEIKVELKRMQCFLKDVDERQDENESVRNWIVEIKELALKTENVIETFVVEIASKREGRGIKSIFRRFACIISEGISLHKVGLEIGNIKNDITNLTRSLQTYGIKREQSLNYASHKELLLRAKYPHLADDDFVGMKKDEELLVSHLLSLSKNNGIITIKGMGGQGKSTIATRIYNRIDVRHNFSCFAWVCITQQCQTKIIWQDILKQLLPERRGDIMQMGDIELAEALYKVQLEKKCLVVLDDIWSTEDWNSLNPAFPVRCTDVGSKLLLTSRKLDAKVGLVHLLGGLNEDEGWVLLQKKAFLAKDYHNQGLRVDPEIIKLGRDIVRKCGGLPLAISVVGGFLKDKTTLREWEMVNKNISLYIRRGQGIEEDYQTVTQVLALSYNDLPYYLKPCFLYFGCFPEDFEIDVELLCLLWIAEGFVSPTHKGEGETMLEVAERYLDELARRSMVQVKLIGDEMFNVTRRFHSCRLHDLMREMCVLKGEKEDFFKLMDYRSRLDCCELVLSVASSSRRLAFHLHGHTYVRIPRKQQHEKNQCVGTLFLIGIYLDSSSYPSKIPGINEFKFLRVLVIKGLSFVEDKDLEGILELIHLRHLSFRFCEVKRFPSSISKLRYLQTLDLQVNNDDVIIPNTIGRMKQLRHLLLPPRYRFKDDDKLRLNGLLQLELLVNFNPTMCNLEDFGRLNKLGVLNANVVGNLDNLSSMIRYVNAASSRHLTKTVLFIWSSSFSTKDAFSVLEDLFGCRTLQVLSIVGPIDKLPKSDHHLELSSSLTAICLRKSELTEDPMEILEKLPKLEKLELSDDVFVGKEMVCSAKGFPQLKILQLRWLYQVEKLHFEDGAMPNLEHLEIFACRKFYELPTGLKFLRALKELKTEGMPDVFEYKLRVWREKILTKFHTCLQ